MPRNKALAEALDRSLDRIQSGAGSVDDCLREYPGLAEELAPLLRTALRTGELLTPSGPTAAYRSASEARLLNRLRAGVRARGRGEHRRPSPRLRAWRPATVLAGLALAVALVGSSFGVASAAAEALPGDRLYGVKRSLEEISLALSPTDAGDTSLLLGFSERRLAEAQALIDAGREDDLPVALRGYEQQLERLLAREDRDQELLVRLEAALVRHELVLNAVLERAAPQARQAIQRALERSERGRQQVIERRLEQGAQDVPPGQLKRTPSPDEDQSELPPGRDPNRTPGPPPDVTRGPKNQDDGD